MESVVQPLLTDLYELTMCYGYWKSGKHDEPAVFDLFFRKNPFNGEFTLFCGLDDCLKLIETFKFTECDIAYLRSVFPCTTEDAFFSYLSTIDCSKVRVWSLLEGIVAFPKVPLITVEGPLAVCQLLESALLNSVNYASLVCTNAVRFRLAAGKGKQLIEFGLRRAQGPNGALSASKYCYLGGFAGTSNVLAGKMYGIPVKGTMAHSFVSCFVGKEDLKVRNLKRKNGEVVVDFSEIVESRLKKLLEDIQFTVVRNEVSEGELASFCAYAIAFPNQFLVLIDTYDVLRSGLINFCACALALHDLGYKTVGVRIDSGDLAYLSKEIRKVLSQVAQKYNLEWFKNLTIVASNDLNERTIMSLNEQHHEIDCFGVGTHLVTCQKQPALGCVYKLVEVNKHPRIKLSQDVSKISIPGRKNTYRLFGKAGTAILDLMTLESEPPPQAGKQILCRHPFEESKRALVMPKIVEPLQKLVYANGERQNCGLSLLTEIRHRVDQSMEILRQDHKRYLNPTPYKVSLSEKLYDFLHSLWLENAPVGQLE